MARRIENAHGVGVRLSEVQRFAVALAWGARPQGQLNGEDDVGLLVAIADVALVAEGNLRRDVQAQAETRPVAGK